MKKLILIYCLVRIPLLFSPMELSGNDHCFIGGELMRGATAAEFLDGMRLPFWDYVSDSYGLGSLLAAAWTAPFFALFGKTLFALKLAPFCWHLLSLVAWYWVFKKCFTPKQTFFVLLFFALPPPHMTKYTLFNIGFHFEMILWMALSLLIFKSFLEEKISEAKAGLSLGLLGGFSTAMILSNLVFIAMLWIYLARVRGTKIRKARFCGFYLAAFFLGLSPWLFYNSHLGWGVWLDWAHGYFLTGFSPFHLFENFYRFLRYETRLFFGFHLLPNFFRHFFTEGYAFIYLFSLLSLLWLKRRKIFSPRAGLDIVSFGILFQVLMMGLIILLDRCEDPHYLFPMAPFMGMTLVAAAVQWKRGFQKVVLIFCVTAGIVGNLTLFSFSRFGDTLWMPGYSYAELNYILSVQYAENLPLLRKKFNQLLEGQPLNTKKFLYRSLLPGYLDLGDAVSIIKSAEPPLQPILYEKLGMRLAEVGQWDLQQMGVSKEFYPFIYRGAAEGWVDAMSDKDWLVLVKKVAGFCQSAPVLFKPDCYEGLGFKFGDGGDHDPPIPIGLIKAELEKKYISDYLKGVGEFLAASELWRLHPKRAKALFAFMGDADRQLLLNGVSLGIANEENPTMKVMSQRGLQWMLQP